MKTLVLLAPSSAVGAGVLPSLPAKIILGALSYWRLWHTRLARPHWLSERERVRSLTG